MTHFNPAPLAQLALADKEVWHDLFASNEEPRVINPGTTTVYQAFAALYLGDRDLAVNILRLGHFGAAVSPWPDLLDGTYGGLGAWVKAVDFGPSEIIDDNATVPPGTLGKVVFIDDGPTRHIEWENGARLGVVPGKDKVEVVLPSKPCQVCGVRCAAADPYDPESYVHDEDHEDDHTAEVARA